MFAGFFLTNARFFGTRLYRTVPLITDFRFCSRTHVFFFAVDPTTNILVLPHTVPLVAHCFLMFAHFLYFCQTQIFFFRTTTNIIF